MEHILNFKGSVKGSRAANRIVSQAHDFSMRTTSSSDQHFIIDFFVDAFVCANPCLAHGGGSEGT